MILYGLKKSYLFGSQFLLSCQEILGRVLVVLSGPSLLSEGDVYVKTCRLDSENSSGVYFVLELVEIPAVSPTCYRWCWSLSVLSGRCWSPSVTLAAGRRVSFSLLPCGVGGSGERSDGILQQGRVSRQILETQS